MLQVEQYEFIRTGYRVYGYSISELVRQTGHSKNTIRKVLRNEHSGYSARSCVFHGKMATNSTAW
jgi:hypothetical protein